MKVETATSKISSNGACIFPILTDLTMSIYVSEAEFGLFGRVFPNNLDFCRCTHVDGIFTNSSKRHVILQQAQNKLHLGLRVSDTMLSKE